MIVQKNPVVITDPKIANRRYARATPVDGQSSSMLVMSLLSMSGVVIIQSVLEMNTPLPIG